MSSPPLAIVDDELFDDHTSRRPHPERPERLEAARNGLWAAVGPERVRRLEVARADDEAIAAVHDPAYVRRLRAALQRGWGQLDADTFHSPGSLEAAWHAAGGAHALVRALMRGDAKRGVALLRPPGHHAEADRAMGFCLLNNVAIAARAALAEGAERVAIVDWDVHHGNGTQHAFDASDEVLFVSLHEWPLYPGTGAASEVGSGAGAGCTANLALPSGCGDEVYGEAFRRVVLPLLRAHRPDVVLVSAGYDAHARDPLAAMELSADAFGAMSAALVQEAEALGHGRVAFVLEGGYDLGALEASVAATVKAAERGEGSELPSGRIPQRAQAAIEQTIACLTAARGPSWAEPGRRRPAGRT